MLYVQVHNRNEETLDEIMNLITRPMDLKIKYENMSRYILNIWALCYNSLNMFAPCNLGRQNFDSISVHEFF